MCGSANLVGLHISCTSLNIVKRRKEMLRQKSQYDTMKGNDIPVVVHLSEKNRPKSLAAHKRRLILSPKENPVCGCPPVLL